MSRRNRVRVDSIEVRATQKNVIGGCGLALFMKYLTKAGVFRMINSRLPESSSNSSYAAEVYVKTLWALKLLYPDINAPLTRIDEMGESKAIRQALMVKELPCSEAVGDWLRRLACCERVGRDPEKRAILGGYEDGLLRTRDMFYEMTGEIMKKMPSEIGETLDFDASCIFGEKACDKWMYNDAKGSMSYLSFMGRICIMAELEEGNHAPADNIGRRIASCVEFAKKNGIAVRIIRSDSAGYESEVINGCEKVGCKYYVRADMDRAVRAACESIQEWVEYDVKVSKGKTSRREMGVAVHCMERTKTAFTLVVKREVLREKKDNPQGALPELVETNWKYWGIATNESVKTAEGDEGLTPAEVEENFNDHCNVENRIKQVKSDTGVGRLPTSELGANRVYTYLMAMLHNLFEMFKYECLPAEYKNKRLSTIVREILLAPGKIVVQGHKMVIDLAVYLRWMAKLYNGILEAISKRVRALPRATKRPTFGAMIFRRE